MSCNSRRQTRHYSYYGSVRLSSSTNFRVKWKSSTTPSLTFFRRFYFSLLPFRPQISYLIYTHFDARYELENGSKTGVLGAVRIGFSYGRVYFSTCCRVWPDRYRKKRNARSLMQSRRLRTYLRDKRPETNVIYGFTTPSRDFRAEKFTMENFEGETIVRNRIVFFRE